MAWQDSWNNTAGPSNRWQDTGSRYSDSTKGAVSTGSYSGGSSALELAKAAELSAYQQRGISAGTGGLNVAPPPIYIPPSTNIVTGANSYGTGAGSNALELAKASERVAYQQRAPVVSIPISSIPVIVQAPSAGSPLWPTTNYGLPSFAPSTVPTTPTTPVYVPSVIAPAYRETYIAQHTPTVPVVAPVVQTPLWTSPTATNFGLPSFAPSPTAQAPRQYVPSVAQQQQRAAAPSQSTFSPTLGINVPSASAIGRSFGSLVNSILPMSVSAQPNIPGSIDLPGEATAKLVDIGGFSGGRGVSGNIPQAIQTPLSPQVIPKTLPLLSLVPNPLSPYSNPLSPYSNLNPIAAATKQFQWQEQQKAVYTQKMVETYGDRYNPTTGALKLNYVSNPEYEAKLKTLAPDFLSTRFQDVAIPTLAIGGVGALANFLGIKNVSIPYTGKIAEISQSPGILYERLFGTSDSVAQERVNLAKNIERTEQTNAINLPIFGEVPLPGFVPVGAVVALNNPFVQAAVGGELIGMGAGATFTGMRAGAPTVVKAVTSIPGVTRYVPSAEKIILGTAARAEPIAGIAMGGAFAYDFAGQTQKEKFTSLLMLPTFGAGYTSGLRSGNWLTTGAFAKAGVNVAPSLTAKQMFGFEESSTNPLLSTKPSDFVSYREGVKTNVFSEAGKSTTVSSPKVDTTLKTSSLYESNNPPSIFSESGRNAGLESGYGNAQTPFSNPFKGINVGGAIGSALGMTNVGIAPNIFANQNRVETSSTAYVNPTQNMFVMPTPVVSRNQNTFINPTPTENQNIFTNPIGYPSPFINPNRNAFFNPTPTINVAPVRTNIGIGYPVFQKSEIGIGYPTFTRPEVGIGDRNIGFTDVFPGRTTGFTDVKVGYPTYERPEVGISPGIYQAPNKNVDIFNPTLPTREVIGYPTGLIEPFIKDYPISNPNKNVYDFPISNSFVNPEKNLFGHPTVPTYGYPTSPTYGYPTVPTYGYPTVPTFVNPTVPTYGYPTDPVYEYPTDPVYEYPTEVIGGRYTDIMIPKLPEPPKPPMFPFGGGGGGGGFGFGEEFRTGKALIEHKLADPSAMFTGSGSSKGSQAQNMMSLNIPAKQGSRAPQQNNIMSINIPVSKLPMGSPKASNNMFAIDMLGNSPKASFKNAPSKAQGQNNGLMTLNSPLQPQYKAPKVAQSKAPKFEMPKASSNFMSLDFPSQTHLKTPKVIKQASQSVKIQNYSRPKAMNMNMDMMPKMPKNKNAFTNSLFELDMKPKKKNKRNNFF